LPGLQASHGRTTVVVAHRLSTIKNADMIVSFKDGRVVEQGTHDQLMEQHGIYYQLVTNQVHTLVGPSCLGKVGLWSDIWFKKFIVIHDVEKRYALYLNNLSALFCALK